MGRRCMIGANGGKVGTYMEERLKRLAAAAHTGPDAEAAFYEFGLHKEKHYDVLIARTPEPYHTIPTSSGHISHLHTWESGGL